MSEPFFWWTDEQKDIAQRVSQFVSDNLEEAESYFWKKKVFKYGKILGTATFIAWS